MEESSNIRWVLHTSCSDQNCLNHIPLLTDDELRYCLLKDKRKTGLKNLLREAKKRNFPITNPPITETDIFLLTTNEYGLREMLVSFSDEDLGFVKEQEVRLSVKAIIESEIEKRLFKADVGTFARPAQLTLF